MMNDPVYASPIPPRRWLDDPEIVDPHVQTPSDADASLETLRLRGEALAAQITAERRAVLEAPLPRPRPFQWLRWLALPRRVRQIERVLALQGEAWAARWPAAFGMAWSITRDAAIGRKDGD